MTVLSLLQSCCYRWNIPFPGAGTIYSNSDPHARQLLHVMIAVCEELRQAACWTQQKRTHTFTTTNGRAQYPLPQDFYAPNPFTAWNTDETRRMISVGDSEFSGRLYGGVGSSTNFEYRFYGPDAGAYTAGGQIYVYPTPSASIDCAFEYLTRNLFIPKYWLPSTAYTSGVYVSANGNIYLCDTNGTSDSSTPPTGTTANIVDGTTRWDYVSTPYETILADTDLCLFDDDLVKLGIRAKWRDEKGEESDKAEGEFQKKIAQAVARLQPTIIGSFESRGTARYITPLGGWNL